MGQVGALEAGSMIAVCDRPMWAQVTIGVFYWIAAVAGAAGAGILFALAELSYRLVVGLGE